MIGLREVCDGAVVLPDDDAYETARAAGFNLSIEQRPAAVAYPADASEVADVLRAARAAGLSVTAQTSGHAAGPLGSLEGTVLLKTARLGGVTVDPAKRIARVGGGVRWRDVVPDIVQHGLVALHGSAPGVGVAGYSLGGGLGMLGRSHGLQAGSLVAIELVSADGELVRADAEHDPELLWALRGGGGCFGIVTALEFQLHPLTEIYAGVMTWDREHAERVLTRWAEWAVDAPDHVTSTLRMLHAAPQAGMPESLQGRPVVQVHAAVQGDPAVVEPLRALAPEVDTFATLPASFLAKLHAEPEDPLAYVSQGALLEALPTQAIDALLVATGHGSDSPFPFVELRQLGGALRRRVPSDGAVTGFDADFLLYISAFGDAGTGAAMLDRARRVKAALAPWKASAEYLNYVEEYIDVSQIYDEATYASLRAVKQRMDPDNLIRANHSV